MPIVRQFATRTQALGRTDLPEIDPDIAAGVGRAAQGVLGAVNKRARTMIQKYDDSRSREAFNDFREKARVKLGELKNLKGREAIGASKTYQEWYEKESPAISGDLDNYIQQEQYGVWSENRRNQDLDAVSGHEAIQAERYNVSVHAGELAHSQGDIMAHFNDDNRIEGDGGVIEGIRESFERTYPGVDKDKEVQAAIANARGLRIQLVAEDYPLQAEKLRQKYKVSLGPLYLTLEPQVGKSLTRKESQVGSDLIRSQHFNDDTAQLAAARKLPNSTEHEAAVRDDTVRRVKERQVEDTRIEKENKAIEYDTATIELTEGRDVGMSKEQLYDLAAESLGGEGDSIARVKSEKLIDSWFKPEPVDWDAVVEVQNEIDAAALSGEPLTNEFLTLNYGGLVGRKLPSLLARNTSAVKNLQKASFTRANENLRNLFKSREFGNPKNNKAKTRYAGIDTELNQFVESNPQGDPVEWLDARMKTYRQEKLAGDLNSWSDRLANVPIFGESSREVFEKITDEGLAAEMLGGSAEEDDALATRLALEGGFNEDELSPAVLEQLKTSDEYIAERGESPVLTEKQIKKALASTEFQDFKLRKLQALEEINQ